MPDAEAAAAAIASQRRQGFRFKNGFLRRLFRMLTFSSSSTSSSYSYALTNELPPSSNVAAVSLFEAHNRETFIASSTPLRIRSLSSGAA
ncbi:unnamed protein product, partial [Dibothriocephalus latus]